MKQTPPDAAGLPPEVEPDPATPPRRPYSAPLCEVVGRLDQVVLGGSPGNGDSGFEYVQSPRR